MPLSSFTPREFGLLKSLLAESSANGHDFGLLEMVPFEGSRKALGGLFSSLKKKGVIRSADYIRVNDEDNYTQYVLAKSEELEALAPMNDEELSEALEKLFGKPASSACSKGHDHTSAEFAAVCDSNRVVETKGRDSGESDNAFLYRTIFGNTKEVS